MENTVPSNTEARPGNSPDNNLKITLLIRDICLYYLFPIIIYSLLLLVFSINPFLSILITAFLTGILPSVFIKEKNIALCLSAGLVTYITIAIYYYLFLSVFLKEGLILLGYYLVDLNFFYVNILTFIKPICVIIASGLGGSIVVFIFKKSIWKEFFKKDKFSYEPINILLKLPKGIVSLIFKKS